MNPNAESYNRICDHWRDYRNGKPVDSCVAEFAKRLKPGAKVLDIGCGTGYPIAAHLSGIGCCVTGIDISERMIDCALGLNLPGAEFFVADLLQFRTDKRFDGVIAFDSIWHIPMEQQSQIYSLIGELIQTGGYFLFTHGKRASSVTGAMFGQPFWYSSLDKEVVFQLLEENGFTVLSAQVDYFDDNTGDRELLVVAQKRKI